MPSHPDPSSTYHTPYDRLVDENIDDQQRLYAMFLHLSQLTWYALGPLSIVLTLILWMIKKDESPFIDDHGREAMNFTLSILLYSVIAGVLIFVVIGAFLLPAVMIFQFIVVIMAAVRAHGRAFYRYPMSIRFIS